MDFPRLPAGRQNASRIGGLTGQAPPSSTSKSVGMWGWVSPAHCPGVVGGSPRRFVPDITTVLAGEPPAEWFDRLPPRQLAPSRESWRFSITQGPHPTEHPSGAVYTRCIGRSIASYTAGDPMGMHERVRNRNRASTGGSTLGSLSRRPCARPGTFVGAFQIARCPQFVPRPAI